MLASDPRRINRFDDMNLRDLRLSTAGSGTTTLITRSGDLKIAS
jgi:hypothetical protein